MIVVLASRVDEAAQRFVARYPAQEAALLTCRDLSRPGWQMHSADPQACIALVDGARLPVAEIDGVLTLLPGIPVQELVHIVEADREYVASEMTAFLLYWLSTLGCPVLNRPAPGCLSGPNWRTEAWLRTAVSLDIPVSPCTRSTVRPEPAGVGDCAWVTIVGDRCCGCEDALLRRWTRQLAAAAGVELLSAAFASDGGALRLVGAHVFPDLGCSDIRSAVVGYFSAGRV